MSDYTTPPSDTISSDNQSYFASLESTPSFFGSLEDSTSSLTSPAKTLEERKAEKLAHLGVKSQYSNLSDTYTDLGDGITESNANKIWNDLTGAQYTSLWEYATNNLSLGKDDSGYYNIATGERYEGPVRRAYGYGTKGDDSTYKFGLARGDRDSSDSRYIDYEVGPEGVDIAKKQHDILLPDYIAQTIEALGHGRSEALAGRVVPDRMDLENYDRFGSGATEYYKSKEAFFGDPTASTYGTAFTPEQAKDVLYQYATQDYVKSPYYKGNYSDKDYVDTYYKRLAESALNSKYESQTAIDEALQTVSAIPAGVAKGLLDLADAAQEALTYVPQLAARIATGDSSLDIDLFDDGYKQAAVSFIDDAVGYDRRLDEITLQRATQELQEANIDLTSWESIKSAVTDLDKLSKIGSTALSVLTDPSFTAGMITEIGGAGAFLGAGTKMGTKLLAKVAPFAEKVITSALQSNLSKIKVDVSKAAIAGDTAKLAELERSYTLIKKVPDLLRGSVYTNADMMIRMNNDITAFKENNNGEGPDAVKLFQIAALNRIASSAEVMSLKSLAGIKDIPATLAKEAVKKGIIRATGETVGKVVLDGAQEGTQEFFDTIVEQLNQKVGAADFENKSISEILSDASAEILVSTIAGFGSGVHVKTGSLALGGLRNIGGKAIDGAFKVSNKNDKDVLSEDALADMVNVVSKNEDIASNTASPVSAYFAAQTSKNPEVLAKAKDSADQAKASLLDGTNTVFQSDEEFRVKLGKAKALAEIAVAEDPSISEEELIRGVIKGLNAQTKEDQALVSSQISEGFNNGKEFAEVKTLATVSEDARSGSRGFLTYYSAAKVAKEEGDTEAYNNYISKLEGFHVYASNKVSRLNAGETQVRGIIETAVDTLVKSEKAKSRKEALSILIDQYDGKGKVAKVANSERTGAPTTEINYFHVAKNMADPTYRYGIYSIIDSASAEVAQMDKIYNRLLAGAAGTTDTTQTKTASNANVGENTSNGSDIGVDDFDLPPAASYNEDFSIPTESNEEFATIPAESDLGALDTTVSGEKLDQLSGDEYTNQVDIPPAPIVNDEYVVDIPEDFSVPVDSELSIPTEDSYEVPAEVSQAETVVTAADKDTSVLELANNASELKTIKKLINKRNAELRVMGVKGSDRLYDSHMAQLLTRKLELEKNKKGFVSKLTDLVARRVKAFGTHKDRKFTLYTNYSAGKGNERKVEVTINELFGNAVATGFTVSERTRSNTFSFTKKFADRLLSNLKISGKFPVAFFQKVVDAPATTILFDDDGNLNYNTVEAMQVATYEYLIQEAANLGGTNRTTEEIGELLGIPEEYVTIEMASALANGGITVKLVAAAIGDKIIKNLGIQVKAAQTREALATSLGITALNGILGDFVESYDYIPSKEEATRKSYPIKSSSIPFIKASKGLFARLSSIRDANKVVEDTLGVEIDKERTYSAEPGKPRKVFIHRAEYQEAPKDHTDVVNRLEQTAFKFNSGHDVLMEMFSKDGILDIDALVEHILGSKENITNADDLTSFNAKKAALIRDITSYQEAHDDMGDSNIFFKWFIAKNHRIHLDSNKVNPQNDKNFARWLLTTSNSHISIPKAEIEAVLEGKNTDNLPAIMFAYSIVQAFDGVKNLPAVDKTDEKEVLAAAKLLLENTSEDELFRMAMESKHLGHAALAIANIRKYMDNDVIDSDMVLEVDGLTNGFAFRSMQFPVDSVDSPISSTEWLEKVGVISENSLEFDSIKSMNSYTKNDVYISVGGIFGDHISKEKAKLDKVSHSWVTLFEKHGKLRNFSDSTDPDVRSFIRNLMKSPVMIFNYAAGINRIASGLVLDQIYGKNYMKGKGLISLLTAKDKDAYVVSEEELISTFGKKLGTSYHKARELLHKKSLSDVSNSDINILRTHLTKAISGLYTDPLTNTLETLFSKQTQINTTFVTAAQFMFDHFKEQYNLWLLNNPEASENDKTEFLKDMAAIIPGISAASSDDQLNKITFLKNALEPTNNDVVVTIGGKRTSANTVSRTFGEPGVGPAVLTVLSLDSSVLAKTINEAYKGMKNKGALIVHDAMVLGVGEHNPITAYNTNFYTTNRGYSISEEFVRAIEAFENSVPSASSMVIIDNTGTKVTFNEMKSALISANNEIQAKRKELFSKNVLIGQMVGPNGTMAHINIADTRKAAKENLAKAATNILGQFSSDEVKKALGKEYAGHMKKLNDMLKGCK